MEHTLATRYAVTRDPESEYPELAGLSGVIIVNDPISDSEYTLCVWGNGASVEQELNSASSVTGFTEIGSVHADLEEIAEKITDELYSYWISSNSTHDGSPRRTTMAMAKELCEEYVLNTIETASGVVDITADVVNEEIETEKCEDCSTKFAPGNGFCGDDMVLCRACSLKYAEEHPDKQQATGRSF